MSWAVAAGSRWELPREAVSLLGDLQHHCDVGLGTLLWVALLRLWGKQRDSEVPPASARL